MASTHKIFLTAPKARNSAAAMLSVRAGNAGAAVAVDTRHKIVQDRKKRSDRKDARHALRSGRWD